jgi:hypothetical protein
MSWQSDQCKKYGFTGRACAQFYGKKVSELTDQDIFNYYDVEIKPKKEALGRMMRNEQPET